MTEKLPPMKKSLLEYTPDRTPDRRLVKNRVGYGKNAMIIFIANFFNISLAVTHYFQRELNFKLFLNTYKFFQHSSRSN